ncbi:efflux RND transporter permease subunit [Niveispirillum fermenti]|uniref:efflux RND transporter permease subunit n=1 Tax=Niveispirillum fermenti TaxID=1233113 RepID=UPI003A84694B
MRRGNISAVAIRHPVPPIVLFIILTLAGLVSFMTLDITNNPDIDFPIVNVGVSRPGAAPSELEQEVTKKVEDAVSNITGIDHVTSTVTDGYSNTTIEFKIGYNTDRAVSDVRDAISRIRSDLPQDIYEPQVQRLEATGDAILYYMVTSKHRTVEQLSWLIDSDIARSLKRVSGVGEVERMGGLSREIRVNLDPVRMMALGVTAGEVNQQLQALNVDMPGGRGELGAAEQSIRTLGRAQSVEELRNIEIAIPGGRKVRLSDIADVVDGTSELRNVSRLDGVPAVGFAISRAPNSSEVTVYNGVKEAIAQLEKDYPDLTVKLIISNVKFTIDSYLASIEALVIGAMLAVGVVWWFLRDMRATLISALAMPLSTIPTFLVMDFLGFTLNGITMLGLALVVGILVDDAIVEIENIVRHIRQGKRPYAAALEAADEIGLAVVATTMTIVVVFLPVSFMPGIAGQFFKSFGITVAVAVLFSLLVARLLTPLMAAYLLTPSQKEEHEGGRWVQRYLGVLHWCLGHRKTTLFAGIAFFLMSLGLTAMLPSGFIPAQDIGFSNLQIEMAPGVNLEQMDATSQRAAAILAAQPEVETTWARNGRGGQVRKASIIVLLKPRSDRVHQKEFENRVLAELQKLPGARFSFNSTGGFSNRDVSIMLTSENGPLLDAHANQVLAEMRSLPILKNVTSTAPMQRPEIQIKPMFDRAAEQGVSVFSIGQVAKVATLGEIDTNSAKFNLGDRLVPIRVQLDQAARGDLDTIANLRVRTNTGETVPLSAVAQLEMGAGAVQIDRFDRARRISVQADLNGVELGDAMKAINALPSMSHLPSGVTKPAYGGSEQMAILFMGFAVALGTAFLLIIAVLVLLFHNFFQPITIMTALPLSLGGAVAGLLMCDMALSLPALIGILMLMGIVTKNSILLVDYAMAAMQDHGMNRHDALMDAGAKRARPIIMTTIAMAAGMVPIALGWGADTEFRQPMAVAVIGGLLTSTLLSLVFVPIMFTLMDDFQHWLSPKLGRFLTPKEEVPLRPHPVDGE